MICVKVVKGAQELQKYLNLIGWEKVLQILPSEVRRTEPGNLVCGMRTEHIVRESTYTVIFEDDITSDELNEITKGVKR